MKSLINILFVIWALLMSVGVFAQRELPQYLLKIDGVLDIDTLENSEFFKEKYLVWFEQAIDYQHPELGTFKQRVFISHYGFENPVAYVCEGYTAEYAARKGYVNEISSLFNTNQIVVEHRYFAESKPEPYDWQYLTTVNAAGDHHRIFEALNDIYTGKWISTGISKGGETAMLYNMYYPDDMDISVPYVGPVAKAVEDGRHEPFLEQVGTRKDRCRILNFQKELLKRKKTILPLFEKAVLSSGFTYRVPVEEAFEFSVLEFSFSLWQWGASTSRIPTKKASDEELLRFLMALSSPDYFAIEGIEPTLPFFYQAAHELGYYGYDTKPFKKYLSIDFAKGYLHRVMLPEDMDVTFVPETAQRLCEYMNTKAHHTILIYGEYDPWSAAAVDVSDNPNVYSIINPKGSHASRIKSLPSEKQDFVIAKIKEWLAE
jgi:hypothetical protein